MGNTGATGPKGDKGENGLGIASSSVGYQAWSNGTSIPSGDWSPSVPKATADKPYIWSRTTITYTDGSKKYSYAVGATPEGITVGGRNYALKTGSPVTITGTNSANQCGNLYKMSLNWTDLIDKMVIISFDYQYSEDASLEEGDTVSGIIGMTSSPWIRFVSIPSPDKGLSGHCEGSYKIPSSMTSSTTVGYRFDKFSGKITFSNLKLEIGNKPTDWSPAPEDLDEIASDAQNTANNALSRANGAYSEIDTIKSTISNIVKDDNGMVSVVHDGDGIQIDMSQVTEKLNEAINNLKDTLTKEESDSLKQELQEQISKLDTKTAYISIGQDDEGAPTIILGSNESEFKVRITNKSIDFMKNDEVIAFANGDAFFNLKTVIQNDVQIGGGLASDGKTFVGPGFIWKTRESGNMGLTYIA